MPTAFTVEGADSSLLSDYLRTEFPTAIKRASSIAVNDTARYALKVGEEQMLKEVRFPAGYLDEPERFWISQYAREDLVEAKVTGRARGTSLKRFALGDPTPASTRGVGGKGPGVTVEIAPGRVKTISSAFVIALKNGNFGVAVKVKNGSIQGFIKKHSFSSAQLANSFYILYGPSVDQVFRSVAQKVAPLVSAELSSEFSRQLAVQVGK